MDRGTWRVQSMELDTTEATWHTHMKGDCHLGAATSNK